MGLDSNTVWCSISPISLGSIQTEVNCCKSILWTSDSVSFLSLSLSLSVCACVTVFLPTGDLFWYNQYSSWGPKATRDAAKCHFSEVLVRLFVSGDHTNTCQLMWTNCSVQRQLCTQTSKRRESISFQWGESLKENGNMLLLYTGLCFLLYLQCNQPYSYRMWSKQHDWVQKY